jgi:hypothetical protein
VPFSCALDGASGIRSTARKRYSSGHCLKSPAREGDRAGRERGRSVPVSAAAAEDSAGGVDTGELTPGRVCGGSDTAVGAGAWVAGNAEYEEI